MNLFKIRGIQLSVHVTFFLLLGYVAWEGWQEQFARGLIWSLIIVLAFFACVVLHELGHSFMARRYGVGVSRILLMPIGGMAEFDSIPREPRKELWITLAGPAVNFVLAGLLWWPVSRLPEVVYLYSFNGLILQLFVANLLMGTFNLVPAFPMDGGRILRAVLATKLTYLRATKWAAGIGKFMAGVGILVMAFWLHSAMGTLLFVFIIIAGETEYRMVVRREQEDAHWRVAIERLYRMRRDEPPTLPG
ncbi:MAG: site-2 protease family protein [Cephaloticoccus sp.]|nr:site-2 protease family protein [Cephaloticoccus sp.]MCF7760756.1 site-2 protease family protein [Cephaloticoccus sp.]